MLDKHTHAIIHLELHVEQQDLKLMERVATITALEKQLQVLQLQVPPTPAVPVAPTEPNAVSNVDEE
jgi:hypothetical protein